VCGGNRKLDVDFQEWYYANAQVTIKCPACDLTLTQTTDSLGSYGYTALIMDNNIVEKWNRIMKGK